MSTLTQSHTHPPELSSSEDIIASTSVARAALFERQRLGKLNLDDDDDTLGIKPSSTGSTVSTAAMSSSNVSLRAEDTSAEDTTSSTFKEEKAPALQERCPPERKISNLSFADLYTEKMDDSGNPSQDLLSICSDGSSLSKDALPRNALDTPPESLTPLLTPSIPETTPLDVFQLTTAVEKTTATGSNLTLTPEGTGASVSSSAMVSETSALDSAPSSVASGTTPLRHPVLYSAIGSLEDPNSSSYSKEWLQKQRRTKFEFPSCAPLLPPMQQQQQHYQEQSRGRDMQLLLMPVQPQSARPRERRSFLSARLTAFEAEEGAVKPVKDATPTESKASVQDDKDKKSPAAPSADASSGDDKPKLPASILRSKSKPNRKKKEKSPSEKTMKTVSISENKATSSGGRRRKKKKGPIEMFRPSSDAYTPRMGKKDLKYKPAEMRTPVQQIASPMGTLSRPNFRDALRRVAMIIHQHIVKIESRFDTDNNVRKDDGLFLDSMRAAFSEDNYATPKYRCTMVRVPMARPGMVFGLKQIRKRYEIPSEGEIYEFAHQLFKTVQLSSECSIVCLIYVERLMEQAQVPLMASTWRPIFMCGLLLASKVWQDLSSWNIEFASVYPQYSLDSINRLELQFLRMVKWDLYISSSLYAKYYFALRSVVEKPDFRNRYNRMVGGVNNVRDSEARKIEERSTQVKEEALLQLSRSM